METQHYDVLRRATTPDLQNFIAENPDSLDVHGDFVWLYFGEFGSLSEASQAAEGDLVRRRNSP